jgi:hypothetical protein
MVYPVQGKLSGDQRLHRSVKIQHQIVASGGVTAWQAELAPGLQAILGSTVP